MSKRNTFILPLLANFLFSTLMSGYTRVSAQDQPDYDQIADKIVNFVLEVQPGDIVLISGTPGEIDLLGSLYVAVRKAGGEPNIEISIPEADKRAIMETSMEYLKTPLVYPQMQMRMIDCIISMGSTETPGLMADIPEERLAAVRQANVQLSNPFYKAKIRSATLGQTGGIPTPAYAESQGADYNEMFSMFWKSIDVDYEALLAKGQAISGKFKPGSHVRITSGAGTDISFKIADIPARTNCGQTSENISAFESSLVWLPSGEVYACVDPGSATGKIVIPAWRFRNVTIRNLQITFANGRITKINADENAELLQERLNNRPRKVLGFHTPKEIFIYEKLPFDVVWNRLPRLVTSLFAFIEPWVDVINVAIATETIHYRKVKSVIMIFEIEG